jgi:Sulfotransferase domain
MVEEGSALPVFKLSRAFGLGRETKIFLNVQGGLTRGLVPSPERQQEQAEKLRGVVGKQKKALRRKDRRIEGQAARIKEQGAQIKDLRGRRQRKSKLRAELRKRKLEIFHLKNELHAMNALVERARDVPAGIRVSEEPEVGSLPDFVIIGAQKCGTTAFYDLLTKHPHVEPAAIRELHYFDRPDRFEKGAEWYRRCFPPPRWKDGRRSITGEKTPYYLFHPHVPRRMAEVIPRARLIVMLRNPVDRAYSQYQHDLSMGRTQPDAFEEVIELQDSSYLPRGIYVDQLLRWSEYFSKEQMLVLKSEDFFGHTTETLRQVQHFLDLPHQELVLPTRRSGDRYQPMDPATRQRLEAYFGPHNQRLYEYLGVDFGW